MISILMGLGLGKRVAQLVGYVALPLLALFLIYLALDAYGDSRYDAGVSDTDQKWEEAGRKLERQADEAAAGADVRADDRTEDFMNKVTEEKEKLDEAQRTGSSPLDVLFGG